MTYKSVDDIRLGAIVIIIFILVVFIITQSKYYYYVHGNYTGCTECNDSGWVTQAYWFSGVVRNCTRYKMTCENNSEWLRERSYNFSS